MNPEDAALLRSLLTDRQVLSLGVLVEGEPYVGLVPFAAREDFSSVIIHASRLARHSKGLAPEAPFGIMIHAQEEAGQDPLQLPRLSLQGKVRVAPRGSAGYDACKQAYIRKFPQSEMTFQLGDFELFELELRSGRLVAGFARTLNLNSDHFRELAGGKF